MLPMSQVQTHTKLRPATKLNSFLRCLVPGLVVTDPSAEQTSSFHSCAAGQNPFKHTTPVAFHQHTSL